MSWSSSLLFAVFLPLQFGEILWQKWPCVRESPAPSGLFVPPSFATFSLSLHSLVWSRASLPATVAAVGPALPQFSIKTPNLNGAFKPRPAPMLPLPLIPPFSDSAFFLPFLTHCKFNGPVQEEVPAQTSIAGSEELNELRQNWFLNAVCRFSECSFH